jgi:hypothetical protein
MFIHDQAKRSILILDVLVIVGTLGVVSLITYFHTDPAPAASDYDATVQEMADEYQSIADEGFNSSVEEVGDPKFSAYVRDVLNKECPVYKPSGVAYRDCLWDIRDRNEMSYSEKNGLIEDIDNNCQSVGNQFGGLVAGEITLSCEAYKFSMYGTSEYVEQDLK